MAIWLERARATDPRKLALLALLLGAAMTVMYRPFSQLEVGDAAIYDYIAQSILRGQVPYRVFQPDIALLCGSGLGLLIFLAERLRTKVRETAYRLEGWTLKDQDKAMETVSSLLGPEDKIYVHGTVEMLTLLGRPNLNPYVFLDWGADDFAAARRNTSFTVLVDQMDTQSPKVVSLSRLRKVNHRADLEKWVEDHYDKLDAFKYESLYIRKQ